MITIHPRLFLPAPAVPLTPAPAPVSVPARRAGAKV